MHIVLGELNWPRFMASIFQDEIPKFITKYMRWKLKNEFLVTSSFRSGVANPNDLAGHFGNAS